MRACVDVHLAQTDCGHVLCCAASDVAALLADPSTAVTASSADFWFLVAALKAFVERTGQLPLEVRSQPVSHDHKLRASAATFCERRSPDPEIEIA